MSRQTPPSRAAVVAVAVVVLVATAATGAIATAGLAQEDAEDGNQTTNETAGPAQDEDVRNLTGDNQTAILAGNESATAEAGLRNATANRTAAEERLPSRQMRNGTFAVEDTVGIYDYAVVTARNGTLQLFVRNATIATPNGTVTMHNTFVAIGDNLSAPQLRALDDLLQRPYENATASAAANVSPVTTNETALGNETAAETANATAGVNATDTANATASGPQLADLALGPLADALAENYSDPVLDQQTRVKADLANVRSDGEVTTYRNVLLRGTLSEVLQGQAATADREAADENETEVVIEREYYDVSNLSAPETVQVGETYTVSATVSNPGEDDGAEEVALVVAGERVDQRLVRLDAGESTTVSFEADPSAYDLGPGTYQHGVAAFADTETAVIELQGNATSGG